jgi:hypothetical protein
MVVTEVVEVDRDNDGRRNSWDSFLSSTTVGLTARPRGAWPLPAERASGAFLKTDDQDGLIISCGLVEMALRKAEAFLIVARGRVRPVGSPLFDFKGEDIGLARGSLDRCATGGVLTGIEGVKGLGGLFIGDRDLAREGGSAVLCRLTELIEEMEWLCGGILDGGSIVLGAVALGLSWLKNDDLVGDCGS